MPKNPNRSFSLRIASNRSRIASESRYTYVLRNSSFQPFPPFPSNPLRSLLLSRLPLLPPPAFPVRLYRHYPFLLWLRLCRDACIHFSTPTVAQAKGTPLLSGALRKHLAKLQWLSRLPSLSTSFWMRFFISAGSGTTGPKARGARGAGRGKEKSGDKEMVTSNPFLSESDRNGFKLPFASPHFSPCLSPHRGQRLG